MHVMMNFNVVYAKLTLLY